MAEKQLPKTHNDPQWKGYTIDELRYRRAYIVARLEVEKERMATTSRRFYGNTGLTPTAGIMGKVFGSLNYIDYAVLAFRLGKRVYSLFHRH